jgi:hypothetical protein
MVRLRVCLALSFALAIVALCTAGTASAQTPTILNQTTCVPAVFAQPGQPGSCVNAAGFLQDLNVDCSIPGPNINLALATIQDRNGPNRITLSGICEEGGDIVGFNRLTIDGGTGATMKGLWRLTNSRAITIRTVLINFSGILPGGSLDLNASQLTLDHVTVQGSANGNGINVSSGSQLGFTGQPSVITGNFNSGIDVGAGSIANIVNVTISNNGLSGVSAHNGGSIILANQFLSGGQTLNGAVDIFGNGALHPDNGSGIQLSGASLTTDPDLVDGPGAIHIHNNLGQGLAVFASTADIEAHVTFDHNLGDPTEGEFFNAQVIAFSGSTLILAGGSVQGEPGGAAVVGSFNSNVFLSFGGPFTLTGGVKLFAGSMGVLTQPGVYDSLFCDGSSWGQTEPGATPVPNNCSPTGPVGSQGPKGDKGDTGAKGDTGLVGPVGPAAGTPRMPTADSATPATGSGATQVFALKYSDNYGSDDLKQAWVWFNATFAASSANSCMVYYDRPTNLLWLLNNAGTAWDSAILGAATTLQNSQCAVAVGSSGTIDSGSTLTLNLAMTFKPAFVGPKNVFMYGTNGTQNSGWQDRGDWTVSGPVVTAVSATPNTGSGATQTFALQYGDTAGSTNLTQAWVWFNATFAASGANSCMVYYDRAANTLFLLNDAGTAWSPPAVIGSGATLQNSQCAVAVGTSSKSDSGNTLTLTLAMTFKAPFSGAKNVYMYGTNGTQNSDWQDRGDWMVP